VRELKERRGEGATVTPPRAAAHALPQPALLLLQATAGNRAVTRLLARELDPGLEFDLKAAMKANWSAYLHPKTNGTVLKAQAVMGIPVEQWLGSKDKTVPQRENFARNLAGWQSANGLTVTGSLDPDTVKAVTARTGGDWAKDESTQDREALAQSDILGEAAREGDDDAQRQAIVSTALSQVGKVNSSDRGDGQKYGGERIVDYYRKAIPSYRPEWDKDLLKANVYLGQTMKDGKATPPSATLSGPWSWCGIFSIWAVKTVTGVGVWDQEPTDYALVDGNVENAKPGDIIHKTGQLNHHCIVVRVDGGNVTTVNGNGLAQSVWVNTESLKNYDYYYDVMSQVSLKDKIAQWRTFYEHHGVKNPAKQTIANKYERRLPKEE
jgi:hypothetical protein